MGACFHKDGAARQRIGCLAVLMGVSFEFHRMGCRVLQGKGGTVYGHDVALFSVAAVEVRIGQGESHFLANAPHRIFAETLPWAAQGSAKGAGREPLESREQPERSTDS